MLEVRGRRKAKNMVRNDRTFFLRKSFLPSLIFAEFQPRSLLTFTSTGGAATLSQGSVPGGKGHCRTGFPTLLFLSRLVSGLGSRESEYEKEANLRALR